MTDRRSVYVDCHATTPLHPAVLQRMLPFFREDFGNAASQSHRFGWKAARAVDGARLEVAALLHARPTEIVFTSGATEAINLALLGLSALPWVGRKRIVTQVTEHAAVLECVEALERTGFEVVRLPVDRVGRIELDALENAVDDNTLVVAVMAANNEVGTVQPIAEIGRHCREKGALFFCDLTQAAGWHDIDVDRDCIDLAALSAHKINGPKGVGALFVRRLRPQVELAPILFGGGQERGLRPGTPNVPGIVGFGAACALLQQHGAEYRVHVAELRDALQSQIFDAFDDAVLNGCPVNRHPGNLNLYVPGVTGEQLMGALPEIAFSSGSACTSSKPTPSHVISALGAERARLLGSVRFGVHRDNTSDEIGYVAERFVEVARRARARR